YTMSFLAVYVMASLAHSESHLIKHAECNEDISMNCEAVKNNMHKSITWYKLNNRTGIIRKRDNNVPEKYDYPRPAWFGENDSLVLPRVRPEDSGTYECLIRAEIGKINRKSSVILHVSTGKPLSLPMYPIQVLEVSTVWTSCGFLIMVLVKITLCIISIGVNQCNIPKCFKCILFITSTWFHRVAEYDAVPLSCV
uniref:Ig-like domain-containing protein n=1 Tax=Esox lucius TaxID=8010 RepID=A0A3P8ZAF0_ESOLU